MKKSILLVLLLLFSCASDDDTVSSKEEVKKDTTEIVDSLPQKDSVGIRPISKEMADTILIVDLLEGETWGDNKDTIFHRLEAYNATDDEFNMIECDIIRRKKNLMLANDTLLIEFGYHGSMQDTAIILKNDSWIYSSTNTCINCINNDIMILDAMTLEIIRFRSGQDYNKLKEISEMDGVLSKFLNKK